MNQKLLRCLMVGFLGLALTGCVIVKDDKFEIDFDWQFAGGASCSTAGVATVTAALLQGSTEIASANLDCSEMGARFADIKDGSYTISLTGKNASGTTTHTASQTVVVDGEDQILGAITLQSVSHTLSVQWTFDVDSKSCTQAQVGTVKVSLYQGDTQVASEDIACSAGGVDIDGLSDGLYTVELTGVYSGTVPQDYYYAMVDATIAGADKDLGVIELVPVGYFVIGWDLGGLDCVSADVDRVRVIVNDQTTGAPLFTSLAECLDGEAPNLYAVGNFPLASYDLILEGRCYEDGLFHYTYEANMVIQDRGENSYGVLSLVSDGAGCP